MTPAWALLCGLELAAIVALAVSAWWLHANLKSLGSLVGRQAERSDVSDAFDKEMKVRLDKALRESK